jgi:hypothetical protein
MKSHSIETLQPATLDLLVMRTAPEIAILYMRDVRSDLPWAMVAAAIAVVVENDARRHGTCTLTPSTIVAQAQSVLNKMKALT